MTTAADDRASGDAFEALLAGRSVPGGAAGLAAFTGAVRRAAASPGRPSAALAELLSTGLLTDQSSPSTRTAPTAGTERSRGRTRRRFPVIATALIAKFLSAGAIAQAAAGAGVVVVVTAGAGTVGVLPDDAQTVFSDVTGIAEVDEEPTGEPLPPTEEVVTPVEGDPSDPLDPADPTPTDPLEPTEPAEPTPVGEDLEDPADDAELTRDEWAAEGPAEFRNFGQWVSYGAARGWNHGGVVSYWAQRKNDRDVEQPEETETPEAPEAPEDDSDDDSEVASDDGDRPGKGNGNGRGKGRN